MTGGNFLSPDCNVLGTDSILPEFERGSCKLVEVQSTSEDSHLRSQAWSPWLLAPHRIQPWNPFQHSVPTFASWQPAARLKFQQKGRPDFVEDLSPLSSSGIPFGAFDETFPPPLPLPDCLPFPFPFPLEYGESWKALVGSRS